MVGGGGLALVGIAKLQKENLRLQQDVEILKGYDHVGGR